jgi:hypothetical protein
MARWDFRFGGLDWSLRLDVFNVFDQHAVTEVVERAEDDTGAANPYYGMTTANQTARRVRIGMGLSF